MNCGAHGGGIPAPVHRTPQTTPYRSGFCLEYNKNMTRTEEFKVSGDELVDKVKQLIKEGNIRRIIIKNKDNKILIEVPLTIGVVGIVLAPVLAAVGAIAALVTECSIVVEREK
jgi:CBS domain-containing protein